MTSRDNAARQPASNTGELPNFPQDTRLLIGARDAAELLDISERSLWQFTRDRAIPCLKIGRINKYPLAGLRAWIAAGAPTEPGAADRIRWEGGAA